MTAEECISLIENSSPNSTVKVVLSSEALTDESLKLLLGFSTTNAANSAVEISEGTYITSDSVIVIVAIAAEELADIEITVKPSLNENKQVTLLTLIWQWALIGETGTIDWGDGTVDEITEITEDSMSHTYSEDSEYTIKISNIRWKGSTGKNSSNPVVEGAFPGEANMESIIKVVFNKEQIISNPNSIFYGLSNLKTIKGVIRVSNSRIAGGFAWAFAYCSTLEDISDLTIIFNNVPTGTALTLNYTFKGCANLSDEVLNQFKLLNWDKERATTLNHTFYNCKSLTRIPTKFIGKNVQRMDNCFVNTSITYLPKDVFNALTLGYNCFFYSKLETISPKLTLDNLTGDYSSFVGCALSYKAIENLYNALPAAPEGFTNSSPAGTNEYTLYIGYNSQEPYIVERLKNLFNISSESLPMPTAGQFSNENAKGWYVTFTDENTDWGKDEIAPIP